MSPARLLLPAALLVVHAACQQAFEVDRHDLVGDRIAAVLVERSADAVHPRALLISDGHGWSDTRPLIRWFVLDPDRAVDALMALDVLSTPDAEGATPTLPRAEGDTALGLIVTFPSGETLRAVRTVPAEEPAPVSVPTGVSVASLPWDLDPEQTTPEVLAVDVRRTTEADPAGSPQPGSWSRLTLDFADDPDLSTLDTRWTATAGTFLELDATTTDWAAADLTLDELEIEEATPVPAGDVLGIALVRHDGQVRHALPFDLAVGEVGPGVWTGTRRLPVDAPPPEGTAVVRGFLVADDSASGGLSLTDTTPVSDPDALAVPLPCEGRPLTFHPDLLLQGRCARADLDGVEVLVPLGAGAGAW